MKIKAILECLNSKPDNSGNRYWAFRYTETATGKQVTGMVSGGGGSGDSRAAATHRRAARTSRPRCRSFRYHERGRHPAIAIGDRARGASVQIVVGARIPEDGLSQRLVLANGKGARRRVLARHTRYVED